MPDQNDQKIRLVVKNEREPRRSPDRTLPPDENLADLEEDGWRLILERFERQSRQAKAEETE